MLISMSFHCWKVSTVSLSLKIGAAGFEGVLSKHMMPRNLSGVTMFYEIKPYRA